MTTPHLQRGILLYHQGRYEDAAQELRMQLTQNSEDSFTHGMLALVLAELERYDEATQHAQQAVHLAPDQGESHYSLARVLFERRRYDEARGTILEAIRLDPYEPNYFGLLSNLELLKSRWQDALDAADQGLAIDPEHNLCTNMRAQALIHLGNRAAAAETMGEALARRPDDALTHSNQGWAMLHAGQPYKALEHFRESLRLNPEMEWSRVGIVEALKARNFFYRWMLAWFLWMSRLTPGVRWAIVIGGFVGQSVVSQWAQRSPELAPYLNVALYSYFAFALCTWLSQPFFNLLLRLDRFGRHALSVDQVRGANVLAACLVVTLGTLAISLATDNRLLFFSALMFALLSLPASAIFICQPGWPRQAMMVITMLLMLGVLAIVRASVYPINAMPGKVAIPALLMLRTLPWAMVASQFAAMYLAQVTPQK